MIDRHSVVYLETAADGQTAEDPRTVADVELRWDTLRTEACKGTESLALIESAAGLILVRDTTNRGGALLVTSAVAWQSFTSSLK